MNNAADSDNDGEIKPNGGKNNIVEFEEDPVINNRAPSHSPVG